MKSIPVQQEQQYADDGNVATTWISTISLSSLFAIVAITGMIGIVSLKVYLHVTKSSLKTKEDTTTENPTETSSESILFNQYMSKSIKELISRLKELTTNEHDLLTLKEKHELVTRIIQLESNPQSFQPPQQLPTIDQQNQPPSSKPTSNNNSIDDMELDDLKSLIEILGGQEAKLNESTDLQSLRDMARSLMANNDSNEDMNDNNETTTATYDDDDDNNIHTDNNINNLEQQQNHNNDDDSTNAATTTTTRHNIPNTMSKKQVHKAEKKKNAQQQREYYEYMASERKKKEEAKKAREQQLELERELAYKEKMATTTTSKTTTTTTTSIPIVMEKEPSDGELISKLLSIQQRQSTNNNNSDVILISSYSQLFPLYNSNNTLLKRSLTRQLKSLAQPLPSSNNYGCSIWFIHNNLDDEIPFLLVSDRALLQLAEHVRKNGKLSMKDSIQFLQSMI
jgi:hypothetical protein